MHFNIRPISNGVDSIVVRFSLATSLHFMFKLDLFYSVRGVLYSPHNIIRGYFIIYDFGNELSKCQVYDNKTSNLYTDI